MPNSFDAPHVHINPTEYNQDNVPGSPGESISAFPLATSAPPLEQNTVQTTGSEPPLEQTTSSNPVLETTTGQSNPGTYSHTVDITPEQGTHVQPVETVSVQTTSQSIPDINTPLGGNQGESTPELNTPVEYPSIAATPMKHKPSETNIITLPVIEILSAGSKVVAPVLVKLPTKGLHLDRKGPKINSTVVNGTVVKINGTLYLVRGSLTKLTKSAHANKLVGSMIAGVAPKNTNEHLVNAAQAGVTTDDGDDDGEMFSYDGTSSTTLEDKPFDAHVIKMNVKNKKLKTPPKKKLTGML